MNSKKMTFRPGKGEVMVVGTKEGKGFEARDDVKAWLKDNHE